MSGRLVARLQGRVGALDLRLAFEADAGPVTAMTGPSGAGKTTILRALAGLQPLSGEVCVGDEVWQDGRGSLPPHRRAVGYVPQGAALLPHLTVRGNLDYGRKRVGGSRDTLDAEVERFALTPLLDRSPDRLSGGERQRVALARALLTRPALLLLDEPLAGLDPPARSALLSELQAVFAALTIPVLYVSHDAAEVSQIADRVLRLDQGRLVGTPPRAARQGEGLETC